MATAVERDEEVVSLELPAPPGWKKKYVIANTGGIPKKNEIVFTSPTGEEITNRKSLDQYIKSHPGGPISSQFDWGTGDTPTPRRSARIIQKAKVVSPPRPPYLEIEQQPNKRRRSSITRKEEKEKEKQTKNENEREKVKEKEREEEQEKDAPAEETKEVVMQDSKNENLETENAAENTVKENHSEKIDSERFQKTAAAGETDNSSTEKPKQEEREEKVEQEEKPEPKDGERKEEENSITAPKPVESETNKKSAVGNGIEEQKKMDATDDVLTADQQNEGKRMENGMA